MSELKTYMGTLVPATGFVLFAFALLTCEEKKGKCKFRLTERH